MIIRRRFVPNASVASAALAVGPKTHLVLAQPDTGMYHNPIMGGDHPDASPIRVGDDFYGDVSPTTNDLDYDEDDAARRVMAALVAARLERSDVDDSRV
jgi:hypothetical protein